MVKNASAIVNPPTMIYAAPNFFCPDIPISPQIAYMDLQLSNFSNLIFLI